MTSGNEPTVVCLCCLAGWKIIGSPLERFSHYRTLDESQGREQAEKQKAE